MKQQDTALVVPDETADIGTARDMAAPAIEARGLRRVFGTTVAVADVSFAASTGEIFGLLGPNGAGKTTTIRLLTSQIVPSGGDAVVAGCDVVRQRQRLKRRIGVVFEEQNLYDRLSARMNLQFSCWLYDLPERRVDEVLALVRLRDRAKDGVSEFSNGMKQRLLIARALLHQPRVLFLDEPSRGLDPISARDVRRTIEELRREGTTILLTTHLMEEADQLCQRVAFIVDGRIVASGAPRDLKLAHGRRSLRVTVAEPGSAAGSEAREPALRDVALAMDDPADQARLAEWMAQGSVRAIHSREATLQEVFIATAGRWAESE